MRKYILNEAALSIDDVYNKYYQSLDRDVFNAATAADPTSYNQGKVVKVGNFVKWILKLYSNNAWKPGDSYETKDLLTKFIKYKSKLPIEKRDINRFNSVSELYSVIQTLEGQGVKSQKDVKKEGVEVVYEDSEWKIVIPHTKEASCIYGANTRWCTAGREDNMFNYYNDKGPLYININKVTGDKYQFHFETNSYMDAEDEKISPRKIGLSEGVIEYYKSIGKESYILYDYVYDFSEGFAKVKIFGKYNFINTKGELLWKGNKWFDNAWSFTNGFARVEIEGRGWNFINPQGELLWKGYKWFDYVSYFYEGFASVKIVGKGFNFINEQGELLWKEDKWFDEDDNFVNGFARVYIDGKGWNYINTQGELLWKEDKWFDMVDDFSEGFAKVKIFGKYNFINTKGELLWKEDEFDAVWNFYNGFAIVYKEGKGRNFINTNGELLWKEDKWFDMVDDFREGFAEVKIEGKGWNYINGQGELVWKEDIWFGYVDNFLKGFAEVVYKGDWYKLNTNGELYDEDGNRVNISIQESKSGVIRLTESDIHNLVIKTLKEYLY
jgi:hypothetical protein